MPDEPLVRWDWIAGHLDEVARRLGEHLTLTLLAVSIGFVVSFALSLVVRRYARAAGPITWAAGVLYTIPSLALFALLIPFTGLTVVTAEVGLVSYTLLILIRAIVGGLESIPAEVRDTALGMGFTPSQILWRVELPLAAPVIIAGVRVATVTTIGLTTVTALIGQGGLGFFILDGLQRFFTTPLLLGAVLSVALAVAADVALVGFQRLITPWARATR
ncbi:MAG TPA: ABC transporter permease [Chloroflexota bacterium]|nr:ABC transporter permease [Chloroflexota bacterium]